MQTRMQHIHALDEKVEALDRSRTELDVEVRKGQEYSGVHSDGTEEYTRVAGGCASYEAPEAFENQNHANTCIF